MCYIRIAHEVFVRIHVSLCENGIFARITNIHFVTNLAPGVDGRHWGVGMISRRNETTAGWSWIPKRIVDIEGDEIYSLFGFSCFDGFFKARRSAQMAVNGYD